MERNKVHHMNWLDNTLPDKSVQLIIADPPYFEVKGEFDFIWESFDAYLQDVEKWAAECARLLADNGSLFWWGDAKKIAYSQVVLDKHLTLLNSLIWEKRECQGRKMSPELMRSFAPVTERLLFYDKGDENDPWKKTALQYVHDRPDLFQPIKKYFDEQLDASGLTVKESITRFGTTCSHFFGFSKREKTQFAIPTEEKWIKLQSTGFFKMEYEELKKWHAEMLESYQANLDEYDEVREGLQHKRRVFKMDKLWTDVLFFSQEGHITGKYDHDTKKPEKLTRLLIDMTTNKGDLILVPFAGSGTECAMAAREGREFIGFDIEAKYVDMANKRAKRELSTPTLF